MKERDPLERERDEAAAAEYDLRSLPRVEVQLGGRRGMATFALRLDPDDVAELRRIAKQRNLGATQLARQWVVERLHAERSPGDADVIDLMAELERRVAEIKRELLGGESDTGKKAASSPPRRRRRRASGD